MTTWSTREITYLEEHQFEGAQAIAKALNRSVKSVQCQAAHYGISLRIRYYCPKCGRWVQRPLNSRTGWCAACHKASRRHTIEQDVHDMREEVMREKDEDARLQALYSQRNRLKNR